MYKGIYWPSLTNSFHCKKLELAYLRYSHRQRQKALIIVNIVDFMLKVSTKNEILIIFREFSIVLMYEDWQFKSYCYNIYIFEVVLSLLWVSLVPEGDETVVLQSDHIVWSVCSMSVNIAICVLGWWKCFANNYLHWAAMTTWLLLTMQSE